LANAQWLRAPRSSGGLAHIAIERLKALDRVAFRDREQTHKPLAPQQLIKLVLARGVAPHQSLQRSGLIGREMINVQIRIKAQAIHHEVDEPLKGRAFLRSRKCPIRHVAFLPVFTSEGVTEQIFKPTIANERITLKIKKNVPLAGRLELGQTKPWGRLQPLIADIACGPAFDLYARLFADALKGARRAATRLEGQGDRHSRQRAASSDLCSASSAIWILLMPATRDK
jgi:hypothetical protein